MCVSVKYANVCVLVPWQTGVSDNIINYKKNNNKKLRNQQTMVLCTYSKQKDGQEKENKGSGYGEHNVIVNLI